MTQITITINLSDLVDVINNSKNPEVCKHLLSGGSMQDLVKFGDHDRFLHKVISRTRREDGEELTLEAIVTLENYNPWKDEVTYRFYEGDREAIPYHSHTGTISWDGWRSLPTANYGADWSDAKPGLPGDVIYDDPMDYSEPSRNFQH
jgi:hypothetical protein